MSKPAAAPAKAAPAAAAPAAARAPAAAAAAAGPRLKTLLVPVDGSAESSAAFDHAVKSSTSQDKLLLFHGEAQAFHLTGSGGMVVVVEPDSAATKTSSALKAAFLGRCTALNRNCEWVAKPFVGGSSAIASDIVKTAESHKADGIVMGARGLSALGSVMLGSVSQSVLQHAQMPVTVRSFPSPPLVSLPL